MKKTLAILTVLFSLGGKVLAEEPPPVCYAPAEWGELRLATEYRGLLRTPEAWNSYSERSVPDIQEEVPVVIFEASDGTLRLVSLERRLAERREGKPVCGVLAVVPRLPTTP